MPSPHLQLPAPAAVILDLDGTLVDTVDTRIRAWLATFTEFDIPASRDQVGPLIGADGKRLAREVASDAGLQLANGRDDEIDRRSGEIYSRLNQNPKPLPGYAGFLDRLDQRDIAWAIATSSRREQVGASVEALGLSHEPTIVDGQHVEHAKPAPDLLLRAAEELGMEPGGCWYVGDSTWDMRASVAAGMIGVGVTAGAAVTEDELLAAGATTVVASLADLVSSI